MSQGVTANHFGMKDPAPTLAAQTVLRLGGVVLLSLLIFASGRAQDAAVSPSDRGNIEVLEGVIDGNAYGVGKSIKVTGTVREGALAFGGDVIVQGTVDGDVAAIGGSVIQLEGARIGGDVIVVGGTYRHADRIPNRPSQKMTLMYSGYQQELRDMMQNPTGLLSPAWTPTYFGLRLLAVLFWFVIAMVVTATLPGAVSRGVTRLQLTSLRLAAIGFLGAIVIGLGEACLLLLPAPFSTLLGLMTIMLIVGAGIFGRVVIYAATGRWLQRRFLTRGQHSESIALLLGTVFWSALSSLPYVWPFILAGTLVLSLGLALTGGRGNVWKRANAV